MNTTTILLLAALVFIISTININENNNEAPSFVAWANSTTTTTTLPPPETTSTTTTTTTTTTAAATTTAYAPSLSPTEQNHTLYIRVALSLATNVTSRIESVLLMSSSSSSTSTSDNNNNNNNNDLTIRQDELYIQNVTTKVDNGHGSVIQTTQYYIVVITLLGPKAESCKEEIIRWRYAQRQNAEIIAVFTKRPPVVDDETGGGNNNDNNNGNGDGDGQHAGLNKLLTIALPVLLSSMLIIGIVIYVARNKGSGTKRIAQAEYVQMRNSRTTTSTAADGGGGLMSSGRRNSRNLLNDDDTNNGSSAPNSAFPSLRALMGVKTSNNDLSPLENKNERRTSSSSETKPSNTINKKFVPVVAPDGSLQI